MTKTLEVHDYFIENSQKYLSYLIKIHPEDCLTFNGNYILNNRLRQIFTAIKNIVDKKLIMELDTLLDECKLIDATFEFNELKLIVDSFNNFENIENVKKRLKENYHKQVTNKKIMEEILVGTGSIDDLDLDKIKELKEQLGESISEIEADEKLFLLFEDLKKIYNELLQKREEGIGKRSCGIPEIDKYYTYSGHPRDMMTIAMLTGVGKCLNKDSLILTDKGFEYIDAYSNNENGYHEKEQIIYSDNGENITSHFYEEEVDQTIKIKTKWGFEIEGTPEHPVKILTENGTIEFRKLSELKENDSVCIQIGQGIFGKDQKINFNFEKKKGTSNLKNIKIPKYLTPDLSRLLGYIIANGSIKGNGIGVSTRNKLIQNDIKNILEDFGLKVGKIIDNKDFGISSVIFNNFIKFLIGNQYTKKFTARYKAVPEFILKGSKENQIEFLKGLFDCDSYKPKDRDCIEYYTASKKLVKEVQLMLLNLGIFSYRKESYLEEYDHIYYTLIISSEDYDKLLKLFNYKSLKYDFKKENKKRNTNIKVIPQVRELTLKNINNLWKKLNANIKGWYIEEGKKYRLPFGKINTLLGKPLTYWKVDYIYNFLLKNSFFHKYNEIQELLTIYEELNKNNFIFDTIKNINLKNEKVKVYDFTIPKEHSFYSNGFISHNTSLGLNMVNRLVNQGVCCIYFALDMDEVPIIERLLCMREGLSVEELQLKDKPRDLNRRIQRGLNSLVELKNYIHYPKDDLSLDGLDTYLYKAKALFRKLGVLPEDEYMVIVLDTNDIIKDFSGKDAIQTAGAVDKLHAITRKHKIFTINMVQINENKIRNTTMTPERIDRTYFTKEDIFGSSAFSKRSRIILVGQRNKHMKLTLFPDHEDRELWELEEDILQLSIVKQNDGALVSLPFIFNTYNYRIIPTRKSKERREEPDANQEFID